MLDLEQLISEKNAADTQWREERQTQRDTLTSIQEAGVVRITSDPATYARYLNMQGDNPTYSPGNIALIMEQMPMATIFGTQDRWRNLGRTVTDIEVSKGAKIYARSPQGRGYVLADAYDISQTEGRDLRQTRLEPGSKEMTAALRAVMNYSLVPFEVDKELPVPAFYDARNMVIAVNPADFSENESFAAIAAEVAHSRFHQKGYNSDYNRTDSELDAQSVSHILCRRFGVQRDLPDLSRVPELYQDWSVDSRKGILDGIQDMSKMIGNSIERDITPQQRTIPIPNRPSKRPVR